LPEVLVSKGTSSIMHHQRPHVKLFDCWSSTQAEMLF
jgi:hypothetical protein